MGVLSNICTVKRALGVVQAVNLSAHISRHIVGEDHTPKHQRIAGVCIMVIGVVLVKVVGIMISHQLLVIHIAADVVGYGLHGIGLIPFAAKLEKA